MNKETYFNCKDCERNTILLPQYMVSDALWEKHGVGDAFLCIFCLQTRMQRNITKQDFKDVPCNAWVETTIELTQKLPGIYNG